MNELKFILEVGGLLLGKEKMKERVTGLMENGEVDSLGLANLINEIAIKTYALAEDCGDCSEEEKAHSKEIMETMLTIDGEKIVQKADPAELKKVLAEY